MAGETEPEDLAAPPGLTRSELLAGAAVGGAGLLLFGPSLGRLGLDLPSALAAPPRPTTRLPADIRAGRIRKFITRPDLQPMVVNVVRGDAAAASGGHLFLAPPSGPGRRGAMIVDNIGDLVWFNPTSPQTTMDFRAGFYRGRPALSWWEGKHVLGVGLRGTYVIADSSYRVIARFRSEDGMAPDFHEFLLTPDNTALVTSYDPVPADLTAVGGSAQGRVYEGVVRELAIPSGRVLFEWRSLDHVAITESYQTQVADPYDYFHVNSIGFDSDGHLLVSARNTWGIYKIHRRTGRVIWRLGGKRSDFAMGKGTRFAFQHDARSHDGGRRLSLFDNGPQPRTKPHSRALELVLDTRRMRATVAREIVHAPPLFARATGNTQLLPDGDIVVCWGITGNFSQYRANGKLRLDAKLPEGGQNYRVFRFPWVGQPSQRPRLARYKRLLYASWNGATEVATWQVHGGPRPTSLHLLRTVPRRGFETALPLPHNHVYVAAVALDRDGKRLGSTKPLRLKR